MTLETQKRAHVLAFCFPSRPTHHLQFANYNESLPRTLFQIKLGQSKLHFFLTAVRVISSVRLLCTLSTKEKRDAMLVLSSLSSRFREEDACEFKSEEVDLHGILPQPCL